MMVSLVKCSITVLILANTWYISAAKFCSMTSSTSSCVAGQVCCNYQCVYGSSCLGHSCIINSECSSFESCCSGECSNGFDCTGHSCYSSGDCSTNQDCCGGICADICYVNVVFITLGSTFAAIFIVGFLVAIIVYCCRRRRRGGRGHIVHGPQGVITESPATANNPPLYYQPGYPQYGYGATDHRNNQPPVAPHNYEAVAGQATGGRNNDKMNQAQPSAPAVK